MSIQLYSRLHDLLRADMVDGSHPPRAYVRMNAPVSKAPPDDRGVFDARLMQRVAKGDRQAFAELYERFSGPLYGMALRIVRDAVEAQDIVHDAFVAVWEKASMFEASRGTAFSWVLAFARNRAIDRVRTQRRRTDLLAGSAAADVEHLVTGGTPSGRESALVTDEARAVREAVATLGIEQQQALALAFFSGLTQEQIAAKLNEPLGTVKARIRRGLLKLRELLAQRP